jgi:hypothetical protein
MKVTQAEMNSIIAARTAANLSKGQLMVQPKVAYLGGAAIGIWKGITAGFTGSASESDYEIEG